MTIDFSKLITAADKAAAAEQQMVDQAERELLDALRAATKINPVVAQVRMMTPSQFDTYLAGKLAEFTGDQQPIIELVTRAAYLVVRGLP